MRSFVVQGSHGALEVDAGTGTVRAAEACTLSCDCGAEGYRAIGRFDLEEWRRAYDGADPADAGIVDLLDLGHWLVDGSYVPPEPDFRAALAAERLEEHLP